MGKGNSTQTKEHLLDAFWYVYCRKPIEKITVRDITERAGYNRGTFYVYFRDVYEALETIELAILPEELIYEAYTEVQRDGLNFEKSFQDFMAFYEEHGDKLRVLLGPNGDPTFGHRMKDRMRELLIRASGVEDEDKRILMEYALEAELSARLGVLTLWFNREKDLPIASLHRLFYDLSMQGGTEVLHQLTNE
ncbi:TetR/AcrR family transcriptional regulator [Alkalicoccus chagannorensis]|uniref:TetR/AcrR family transcriptional regulator n=1 Tax=Alkalicoccus chagannorensis TaxID=427072 RepID=UPI0004255FD1|nr:TetR/AcrR family transcriptional regulator [Alkalicoccus chagannorensis]